MLTDVPVIDQRKMANVFRYAIASGSNALVLGPSGGGKTHIAFQVIEEANCKPIYINMAVLERTDFQGMPVISIDRGSVNYAVPDFLPFNDIKTQRALQATKLLLKWVEKSEDKFGNKNDAVKRLMSEVTRLEKGEELHALQNVIDRVQNQELTDLVKTVKNTTHKSSDIPLVFLFDEVDKAIPEVLQTLLEFLQFHSINGRGMNIKACFLTANLPDEHAHTNQISHAITKRCMTFKLELDFGQWRTWAIDNGVNPLVIGFLTQNSSYLHKPPPDGDPTAYALPSPRTWSDASKALRMIEEKDFDLTPDAKDEFRLLLMAGSVGLTAASHFNVWHKHYHKLDPVINDLLENGKYPDFMPGEDNKKLDTSDYFICALSACSKIEQNLKDGNEKVYTKYIKNTFNWFSELPVDIQLGSIRMIFGNNFDKSQGGAGIVQKFKLAEIPEFTKVFIDITKNKAEWEKFNNAENIIKIKSEFDKLNSSEEVDENASGS